MGKKRLYQTGVLIYQGTSKSWPLHLPECFPPDHMAELKCDCFYGGLPKWLKPMVAYLKASLQEKMYSNYIQAMREAEKENSMESSQSQTANNTAKPKVTSFFLLQKLKGAQPAVKTPASCAKKDKEVDSEDPDSIEDVTEEFMVCLVRAMKDAQKEEKCCYHCSSLEHFIHDCLLVKASRTDSHLNCKEGMAPKKGAQTSQMEATIPKMIQRGHPRCIAVHTDSLLES